MSRIGKKPIEIPAGINIEIKDKLVKVSGPKGVLMTEVHPDIEVKLEGKQLKVINSFDDKFHKAIHGTTRALLTNMIEGVLKGFEVELEIVGVGYRARMEGKKLILSLGYSHPIEYEPPPGITIEVPDQQRIIVKGIDKRLVGQVAAIIRSFREPDSYKGKGIRYKGEEVRLKPGKAAKTA
ncbi:MAG: 50S ribosomal protein L6 [Synergistetes bacterium]|nr:50S ribosomal protein L6 [Synergistota bacterium]MCX8128085.1 50S ribosomal protein L6 [Synergistota bacterium]MDW8192461.1 50S ribosomal protein L6 [Synergistota bacterium]